MSTEDERVYLTMEQLDAMMPDGDQIHTFIEVRLGVGLVLIGADWDRDSIMECARRRQAELSGEGATAMGHGIVVWTLLEGKEEPVFVETKKVSGI